MRLPTFCLTLALTPTLLFADAREIELYMPDAPPLSIPDAGEQRGITGDVAVMALQRAGFQPRIRTAPWLRAQKRVLASDRILIVPLTRTPEREQRFTWIAKILPLRRAFFSLEHPADSLEEARQRYRLVAVGLGTAQEEILRQAGFSDAQLYALKLGEHPAQLVRRGRVDAWFTTVPEGRYRWDEQPALAMGSPLSGNDMYIGCSAHCDPELVQGLRSAMTQMRSDGSLQQIIQRYLSDDQQP